jgi:hypothetical protein
MKCKFSICIFLSLMIFTSSCKKNTKIQTSPEVKKTRSGTIIQMEDGTELTYKFFINESEVNEISNPLDYRIAMTSTQTSPNQGTINVYAFTSNEKFVDFGNRVNPKLVQSLLFEETMQEYTTSRNFDLDNFEPDQAYLDFEKQTYEDIAKGKKTRGLVMLHDTYISGGSSMPMPLTLPVMWPGWNNRVKRYLVLNVAATMSMYDKAFYKKHLFTTFNWGWTNVSSFWAWNMFWDSKMSSGVSF